MSPEIDLNRGGYQGDEIEQKFRYFTELYMEYWWHFREVLLASDRKSNAHWQRIDQTPMQDSEHRRLFGISLTNYAVYCGIAEALSFHEEIGIKLHDSEIDNEQRLFEVRRAWKAAYSSLYSSFSGIGFLLCEVVGFNNSKLLNKDFTDYGTSLAKEAIKGKPLLEKAFEACLDVLTIRNHLEHYWLYWHDVKQRQFLVDKDFRTKGLIRLEPPPHSEMIDAHQALDDSINQIAANLNIIYKELSVTGGYLDKYLQSKNWMINYGTSARPKP